MDAIFADLSNSAAFSRKYHRTPAKEPFLAIASNLFALPWKGRLSRNKITLLRRPPFVGAGIVVRNQGGCPPSRMLAGASRGKLMDPTTMKKLLPTAVMALVVSGFATAQSFAGCTFGLFYNHCGCCGCGAKFCVRQYNAFSPVCSGTVFCDGCTPFGPGCGGGGYGGYGPCAGGMCPSGGCGVPFSGMLSCPSGGCADGACLGSLPASEPAPADSAAPSANPVVSPSALPSGPTSQVVNDRPIQNATYRSVGYTAPSQPAPVRMQPQMIAAPSYWGN